jgi:ABC-2 type transport system ATP-binding protein
VRWAIDFAQGFFGGRADLRDEIIRQLDLEAVLDSPMGSLSKGQRKRALLAIGLLTPQPVLLADEPFDGLDLRQSREAAQTLRSQAAKGRTMVLSIHQISQAARVCDRFVLLSGGRVCGEGTLEELAAFAAATSAKANLAQTLPDTLDLEEVFLALT